MDGQLGFGGGVAAIFGGSGGWGTCSYIGMTEKRTDPMRMVQNGWRKSDPVRRKSEKCGEKVDFVGDKHLRGLHLLRLLRQV